jgi:hypothetical protein
MFKLTEIWRVLALAAVHFVLVLATAIGAFGWDLDRLSSRSIASQVAEAAHSVLLLPYSAVLRGRSGSSLSAPLELLFANSVLWGVLFYVLWRVVRGHTRKQGGREKGAA